MDITIRWKIDDGTLRPKLHFLENILELTGLSPEVWELYSDIEKKELIEELVEQDFREKINYLIDSVEINGERTNY